nr:hypothetical protein [Tanacetum cinerariifolium]
MTLTFADTHNMIAYLTKLDASEGFNQIIDFLNASSIKYALTVNPNIYVSCIKQFWTSVSIKIMNDVPRLQALVDKKKVVITKATIRDALRLDDVEGIDCLPNEEIFTKLARMGYEKPSTKLTFYKAFFSQQWKFLIHTILQCMSAKRTSWNKFSSSMALAVMCLSTVGDLSLHITKYSSPALTQKVFANMRRVGKGCSGVETPLFEGMIVAPQVGEGTAEGNVDDVLAAGVAIEVQPTPPPSPIAQPPSPQQQPQPLQDADISMDLLHNLLDTCTTLTRRVENLKQDKIAQALEITKLKQRVKKLERRNKLKVSKLRRLKKAGTVQRVDTSDDTVMDDVSKHRRIITDMDADVDVTLKDIAKDVAVDAEIEESADDDDIEPSELHEVVEVVTTAKLIIEVRKGVVIRDPKETATPSTIIHTEPKSKDKGKGIMVYEPKPLKKKTQIEQDEAYARELKAKLNKNIDWDEVIDQVQRKEKEDNAVTMYQAMKRKTQTEAQARKNMMIYLRNMKTKEQMKEEERRALKRISKSQKDKAAKKQKLDEEVEELKRHLQIVPNDEDDVYTEGTPLAHKVPVVDYEIYTENNKPYYKIIRANGSL